MFVWQLHSISCLLTMSIPFCATYCTLSDPVIEDANGNVTSMVADEILPNIEIYGQNEIVDVIKSNPSIAKIVSRLFSVDSILRQTIDEA